MQANKETTFELNLLPVISLLAVCIAFLLATTTWINIGTVDVKQAIGEPQNSVKKKEAPSLWVSLFSNKKLVISLKGDGVKKTKKVVLNSLNNDFNWKALNRYTQKAMKKYPTLKTALVLPSQRTKYKDMIQIIDELKKINMTDVGIAPL